MAFNVGDKVFEAGRESDGAQTVEFGPYQACAGGVNRYVVKNGNGHARELSESVLKAAPKFKAGDRVTVDNYDGVFEIAYGPFETIGGKDRYLVKDSDGIHRYWGDELFTLVEAGEPRIGDRVRILSETRRYAGDYAGKTGTLKEIDVDDPGLPYFVDVDNGRTYWVYKIERV